MVKMVVPGYNALANKNTLIKVVRDLCEQVNALESLPLSASAHPFKPSWRNTAGTELNAIEDFCADVYADSDAVVGMSFLGELTLKGLPANLLNGEARIEVLGSDNEHKLLLVTLTSRDTSPYHWEYTYPSPQGWRSWEPANE